MQNLYMMEESNFSIESTELIPALPPELWTQILDWKYLHLRTVSKLFYSVINKFQNYDMISLTQNLQNIAKWRKSNRTTLTPDWDLRKLKTPKYRYLSTDESEGHNFNKMTINVLAAGESKIGITSLYQAISSRQGVADPIQNTIIQSIEFKIHVEAIKKTLEIVLNPERSMYLVSMHVLLLCFSFDDLHSFTALMNKWVKSYYKTCKASAHVFIVGLKADIPGERRQVYTLVHPSVPNYLEVSAKEYTNVDTLMDLIVKSVCAQELNWRENITSTSSKNNNIKDEKS